MVVCYFCVFSLLTVVFAGWCGVGGAGERGDGEALHVPVWSMAVYERGRRKRRQGDGG